MSSINTNVAAMTALQTLNMTNKEMLVTQNRVSTGLRVQTAADNAAYWSIATTMRSDRMALSTVQDALGLGAATVDTATSGLTNAISIASQIKAKLVAARAPGVDRSKIQSEITQLQSSLQNTVEFGELLRRELALGRQYGSYDQEPCGLFLTRQHRCHYDRHHQRRHRADRVDAR